MENEGPTESLFTESEAAAILGMSPRMLADRRRGRKIECVRDGRYYIRYRQRDIDGYLAKFATTPAANFATAPAVHTEDSATRRSATRKPTTQKRVLSPEEAKALEKEKEARRALREERHILKYGMSSSERYYRNFWGDHYEEMMGGTQKGSEQELPGTAQEGECASEPSRRPPQTPEKQ